MPERPGFNPDATAYNEHREQKRDELWYQHLNQEQDARAGHPDYRQSPREKSFVETGDESERQGRYRMTAYDALDNVRAILTEPDGLDDSGTRAHLHELRAALDGLDLDPDNAPLQ